MLTRVKKCSECFILIPNQVQSRWLVNVINVLFTQPAYVLFINHMFYCFIHIIWSMNNLKKCKTCFYCKWYVNKSRPAAPHNPEGSVAPRRCAAAVHRCPSACSGLPPVPKQPAPDDSDASSGPLPVAPSPSPQPANFMEGPYHNSQLRLNWGL